MRTIRLLITLMVLSGASSAWAASLESAVAKLGHERRVVLIEGVAELGHSVSDRALPILEALAARKLRVDEANAVLIEQDNGLISALTGESVSPTGETRTPVVNNKVRRSLSAALAQLRLSAPDVSLRLASAEELAKRPNPDLAQAMRKALDAEKDESVRRVLTVALAKVDLRSGDKERKLAAIAVLDALQDVSLQAEFESILAKEADGTFSEPDADVREAARSAVTAIKGRMRVVSLVANTLYGLSLGSVLLLAALGLAITFGLMRVINMAHGEMLMIGAYTTYVIQNLFARHAPALQDYYLLLAAPASFFVAALAGMALERTVIRHLYGRPLETLLATWGLSLMLIQTVRLMFGAQNVTVANPSWLSGGYELMPTLVVPYSRIAIVFFTAVVVLFIWLLLQRTPLGLQVRAVTQNRTMAAAMGIPVSRVDSYTFGLGSGVAGLGGLALSQLSNVGPELGQGYIVDSFMVVVLGGVGKLVGTVVGAMGLGMANKYLEPTMGAVLGKIAILVLIILFIQKRPQGLFALKGRAAEA